MPSKASQPLRTAIATDLTAVRNDLQRPRKVGLSEVASQHGAKMPLLTILIVVFNDCDELQKIVASILPFHCAELEIVVIDGFSKDGTAQLLENFGDAVDYWLSEPDKGIYDAMNKGVRAAKSTYLLHLNAGDRLLEIPWENLRQCAAEKIDVVCCRVLLDSTVVFTSYTGLRSKLDNTWHHQGTFYRQEAHLGYDTQYPMGADCDHNQRLLKAGCSRRELPVIVADHDLKGVSANTKGHDEIFRIVRSNFGRFYLLLAKLRFAFIDLRTFYRVWRGTSH